MYISDDVSWTTTSLRSDLARMKAQHNVQWFILDYAYLLKDGIGLSENDRTGVILSTAQRDLPGAGYGGDRHHVHE